MFKRIFRSTAAWATKKGKQQVNYTVDLSNVYNFNFSGVNKEIGANS